MWKMVKLGDVCKITNGSTPLRKEKRYWAEGNIPWFTIDDLRLQGKNITHTKQNVTQAAVDDKKVRLVPANSVLLCCTASIGAAAIARVEMATNQQFNALTPKSAAINSDYLYFVATTLTQTLLNVSGSTTINFVSMSKLREISIPLPPLAEQERIVAKLDAAFAEIDSAIEQVEAKQADAKRLKASLLGISLRGDAVMWKTVKLGDVCELIGGGTPSKKNAAYYGGEIPWATVRDMHSDELSKTELKITQLGLENSSSKVIPANNIVIASRVGLGKVCLLNQSTAINQDLRGVIPKKSDTIDVRFLFYWFKSIEQTIISAGRGATVHGVTLPFLKALELSLPPLAEQQHIVSKLDAAFAEIETILATTSKSKENYSFLKSAILTQELQPPQSEAA
jgi:restriction endonuclease S subunit